MAFDTAFTKELLDKKAPSRDDWKNPPISGSYLGFTNETDNSEQRIEVELEFGGAGLISGSGKDSRDGKYMLKGNYSETRVKWIEYYDDYNDGCTSKKAFSVTVRGTYKRGRRFKCFFRSSRGITGDLPLGLKRQDVELPEEDELRRRKPCIPD